MQGNHLRWSYLSTCMTVVLQLLAAVTLTRFLQPKDYGLAALALLCTNFTAYLSQLGVGRALVQQAFITQESIRAAFTLALTAGIAGTLLLLVIAPAAAKVMHDKRLTPVISVLSLNLLFQATALVSGGLLRRELRMRSLALCDVTAYALSTFGIGLPLAVFGYGVWALIASTVSQSLIQSICYFTLRPHSLSTTSDWHALRCIGAFSSKVSMTTAIEACGSSVDLALSGKLFGAADTGLYSRSLTLSTQPCIQVSMGLTRVFAPTLARTLHTADRIRIVASVVHAERQLLSIIFPLCTFGVICAPALIPVVFGRHWISAVPVYRILCLVAAFDASFDIPALQLEVMNQFRAKVWLQGGSLVTLSAAIVLVAPVSGLLGVATACVCVQLAKSLIFHWISANSLHVGAGVLLKSWRPGLVCSAAVALCLTCVGHVLPARTFLEMLVQLSCSALCAVLICAAVYYFLFTSTVFHGWMEVLRSRTSSPVGEKQHVEYQRGPACAL